MVDKFWHIEPTSRCTLACSKCTRTINAGTGRYSIGDLKFDEFKQFFDDRMLADNPEYFFIFCGNLGDPIYHPEFFRFIKYLKNKGRRVSIVTNGSARTEKWWHHLASLLDETDKVTFSADGLVDSNHIYRVNANWNQILTAMRIIGQSKAQGLWKFIVFKHNEHQLKKAKHLAATLNLQFYIHKSERWDKDDPMRPSDQYVSNWERKEIMDNYDEIDFNDRIMEPNCNDDNKYFLAYDGYFYPCCWSLDYSRRNLDINENFRKLSDHYHISKYTYNEILAHEDWRNVQKDTKNIETACQKCRAFCSKRIDI